MAALTAGTNKRPPNSGEISDTFYNVVEHKMIRQRVVQSSAGATAGIGPTLPAGAHVVAAAGQVASALTFASGATRVGIGTSTDPCRFFISGTSTSVPTTQVNPTELFNHKLIFSNAAASAAISNTATETAFTWAGQGAPSIPANFLKPGDVIRLRGHGIATATNSTDTLLVKVYIGSVPVAVIAARDVADNDTFAFDTMVQVRKIGSSGTLVAMSAQPVSGAGKSDGTSAVTYRMEFAASTAIDTTAALAPTVKATWSVASSSNSCRCDTFVIEIIRPGDLAMSSNQSLLVTAVDDAGTATGTWVGSYDVFIFYRELVKLPLPS